MNTKLFSTLLLALTLSGCASIYQSNLPQIREVIIHKTFEFEPSYTRVFIQNGRINRGFDHYEVNCNLEIRKKDDDNTQQVKPGSYLIRDIRETMQQVVFLPQNQPIRVAAVGIGINFGNVYFASGLDTSPSYIYRGYHINLEGEDKNVMRVSCRGVYDMPSQAELPTLVEMQKALGDWISLN